MLNSKLVVNVKAIKKANHTGARAKYLAALIKHNGKTVKVFAAHCKATPPSVPARGKYAGKQEPLSGWLAWFTRNGYLTIS